MTVWLYPSHQECFRTGLWKALVRDIILGRQHVVDFGEDEQACIEFIEDTSQTIARLDSLDWYWADLDARTSDKIKTRPAYLDSLSRDQEFHPINTDGYELAYCDTGCPVG